MSKDALVKTGDGEYRFDVMSKEVKDLLIGGESAVWINIPYAGVTVKITYDRTVDATHVDIWRLDTDDDYPIASASTMEGKR